MLDVARKDFAISRHRSGRPLEGHIIIIFRINFLYHTSFFVQIKNMILLFTMCCSVPHNLTMPKKKSKPPKVGRPSKFKDIDQELLKKLYLAGHTDFEICHFMKMTTSMLYRYQLDNPKFRESILGWKKAADERVERALFERARGYSHKTEEVFCAFGQVTRVETVKHYPPSEVACMFWLKNRKPQEYRDKPPEPEDQDLKDSELVFTSVPKNGDGAKQFKRFFDN